MTDFTHSGGIMAMLVSRFEDEHLDLLLDVKRAVDGGARLDDHYGDLLRRICDEAIDSKRLVDRHPEYHALYARSARLFKQIADQALENEMNTRAVAAGALH